MLITYSSGANISWEENMFNYYFKTLHGRNERGIGQLVQYISRNMWKLSLLSVWMNGICKCVLYCSFISMVSGNVFFIDPLYEWDIWMFSLMFVDWMESMNVFFIVCLYERNLWIFLYCFLIWIDSVKGFYIMCMWMESVNLFFIVY